jgi:hypothetical protein
MPDRNRVGAPLGSRNAAKGREFEQTVRRAVRADDGKRLRKCAETLLNLAAEGERWAVECLRDTLDGKPTAAVNVAVTRTAQDMDDAELLALIKSGFALRDGGEEVGADESAGLH